VDKIVWLKAPCGRKIEYDLTTAEDLYDFLEMCQKEKAEKK